MIQETKGLLLICDGCGDNFETDGGMIQVFTDASELSEMALDTWKEVGDKHYCEKCQDKKGSAGPSDNTPKAGSEASTQTKRGCRNCGRQSSSYCKVDYCINLSNWQPLLASALG
jgi:hypothetical protein